MVSEEQWHACFPLQQVTSHSCGYWLYRTRYQFHSEQRLRFSQPGSWRVQSFGCDAVLCGKSLLTYGSAYCLHLQGLRLSQRRIRQDASFTIRPWKQRYCIPRKKSVDFYRTARRYISEQTTLQVTAHIWISWLDVLMPTDCCYREIPVAELNRSRLPNFELQSY
jgi:hypothetical protein